MRLRSFTADSLPDAMQMVRDALGNDAVILSTQELGGRLGVKITAALEEPTEDEFDFEALPEGVEVIDTVAQTLDYHQVPAPLAERLLSCASMQTSADGIMALAGALDSTFEFSPLPGKTVAEPMMVVGPSGSGKTATAAKLCALIRLAGGEATLITLDAQKAGGLSQAKTFADTLGVSLRVVNAYGQLAKEVKSVPAGTQVIIDTPGVSPYDEKAVEELGRAARSAAARPILTLPAGGDGYEQAEAALAYSPLGARQMIATRLDSSRRYGGILCAAHTGKLSLMGAGIAAEIAGGLASVNPVSMARLFQPGDNSREHLALILGSQQ